MLLQFGGLSDRRHGDVGVFGRCRVAEPPDDEALRTERTERYRERDADGNHQRTARAPCTDRVAQLERLARIEAGTGIERHVGLLGRTIIKRRPWRAKAGRALVVTAPISNFGGKRSGPPLRFASPLQRRRLTRREFVVLARYRFVVRARHRTGHVEGWCRQFRRFECNVGGGRRRHDGTWHRRGLWRHWTGRLDVSGR